MAKTSMGFESMTGHRNHIAVLWVVVLFVLVTVLVTTYGGQMEKLPEREFPKTQIHDDLRVDGTIRMDNGPKLNHVKLYTDASFLSQGKDADASAGEEWSNLVTTAGGTTAYRLPAGAAIADAFLYTTNGVSSTDTGTTVEVGVSTVSAGDAGSAVFIPETTVTLIDAAGDTRRADLSDIGNNVQPSSSQQYVVIGVSNGTSFTSGSLELDLYYYKY